MTTTPLPAAVPPNGEDGEGAPVEKGAGAPSHTVRERLGRLGRRAADLASIPRDWIAFQLVMRLPIHWRLWHAALPYAGAWAYRDDEYVAEVRRHWIATGERVQP
jgi:hypothetical protein